MEGKIETNDRKPACLIDWLLCSIAPTQGSLERDIRFIFCASAISYILNDWSGLDIEKTIGYIKTLQVSVRESKYIGRI
jgi:prenyltransferase beta subunit